MLVPCLGTTVMGEEGVYFWQLQCDPNWHEMKGAQSAWDMAPVAPSISQYDPLGNIFFCSLMFAPITFVWQRGWQTFQTFDVICKYIYYIKICTNLFIWLHKIEITHPSHTERFLFVSLSPSSSARWWQLKYATRTATGKSLNRAQMSSASLS